jgi:hypothetical protein
MTTIQLTASDLMPKADDLAGQFLDARHYNDVVRDTATVLKPDGTVLFSYVQDAIPRPVCERAFNACRSLPLNTQNRGLAAGAPRFRRRRRDGVLSLRLEAPPVASGVLAFLDRNPQMPFCRMSALALDHPDAFRAASAKRLYRSFAPERWEAQRAFIDSVSGDFVIPGTVFTTITVNRSWRTAAHRDAGDHRQGLGVMCALEGGRYYGGELIFPAIALPSI